MGDDGSWRTQTFRQSVVAKIEEAIRESGMNTSRNSLEMENHVFQKAKSKDEYLSYVARLILHVREMNTKKVTGMGGVPGNNQNGPGMQDPINALQNLATQGSRNPLMNMGGPQQNQMGVPQQITATNLLQTLNRGPGQPMNSMQGNMQPRPNMGLVPNGGPLANQMSQLSGQMPNQMPGQIPNNGMNQLPNQLSNQLGNQMQGGLPNQMSNQMPGQMQMGGPMVNGGPMSNQMSNQIINQMQGNKPGQMIMTGPNTGFPRNPTPNQFLRQSPSPSVQSPAGLSGAPPSNQMVASPALVPSPGPQICMLGAGPPRSVGMVPSPGGSLNTPGQPNQSPMGMQEEQAYREKVRQLSKYIDPLRKMIARIGNDGEHVEKLSKMKKLLEILSNPQQRMPLETLKKCEVVLEKLDFKRSDGSVSVAAHLPIKEHHFFNPLLEAVSNNLQSPVINHTLHRTFGPTLEALFGPEIKLVPLAKKPRLEESPSEIPDVLQGEIARLDQRFKVSLDPNHLPGSRAIQLTCWLDDKQLPYIPSISLMVPEEYPKSPPYFNMSCFEHNTTPFLEAAQRALESRMIKLPRFFSVSQLLDTWEMSVRQAAAPTSVLTTPHIPKALLME